jgi:hypothetical protein
MPRGRQSRALSQGQIERLKEFQRRMHASGRGGSVPQLKLAMNPAPFHWPVLQRALRGEPIWILNYEFIVEWLDRVVPNGANSEERDSTLFDSKRAASGERDEEIAEEHPRLRSE